jgi:outer membrane protein assembly factor BamE (lipoprotein component of BamABCDE complex)
VRDDPTLRIATFPADIQAAIKAGKIVPCMTREQVIIAVGPPRTDETASLERNEWMYRANARDEYVVVFGPGQRVKEVDSALRVKRMVVYTP